MLTAVRSNGKKTPKNLLHWAQQTEGAILATPNYGFEKRQKELAKKRKKEDKLKAKADRKAGLLPGDEGYEAEPEEADGAAAVSPDAQAPAA
jgi:hypothetical protein